MMKITQTIILVSLSLMSGSALAQSYNLDFEAPKWRNGTTSLASEFQSNAGTAGNDAGWADTHVLHDVDGSGIGATLQISHQPNAWNMADRPSLSPYFPSDYGTSGRVLRAWNNGSNIPAGEIPTFTVTFAQSVKLHQFGLEGFRGDDAWKVQAYDAAGGLVNPLWRNPNFQSVITPGDPLGNTAINILNTEGTLGAEALGAAKYLAEDRSFVVWNKNNAFERGAAVIDYNGAVVKTLVYSMIEVNADGNATGAPADQSMYIGSGIKFETIPEPSSISLFGLGGMSLLLRRRR